MRDEKNSDKNFVFSPFSLHITLAMLTAASTDNSTTQNELLNVLGRVRNIKELSEAYRDVVEEYEVILTFK